MPSPVSKRVLHLRSSGGLLGAEQVILGLCQHSREFGYEPLLALTHDRSDPVPQLHVAAKARGIESTLIECRHRFDPSAFKQLRRLVATSRIDVLHTHGYREDFYAVMSRSGATLAATNHLWKRTTPALRFYARADALLLSRFDRVVAVSAEIQNDMKALGFTAPKLAYIPNGIDLDRFETIDRSEERRRTGRHALGLADEEFVLATTGSLTEEKGHAFMLEALSKAPLRGTETVWLVAGDGPEAEELEQLASSWGVADRVRFLGRREDIPELLGIADAFVLPSLIEGLPMALLEAMASGLACVASAVGDVGRAIEDGISGLLVERSSSSALGQAVDRVLRDRELRERLARNAAKRVREEFSSRRMTQAYCAEYDAATA